jgi:hypothetical protein
VATALTHVEDEARLLVTLPDGSPGSVPVAVTDIGFEDNLEAAATTLTVEGFRRLLSVARSLTPARQRRISPQTRK